MQTPATHQIFMMKRWIQWNENHLWINRKAISHILYTIYFKWELPGLVEPMFLLLLFIGTLCSKRHYYSHANTIILVQFLYKNFQDFHRLLRWMAVKTGSNIGKEYYKTYHFFIWKLSSLYTTVFSHSLLVFLPFNVAKKVHFWRNL